MNTISICGIKISYMSVNDVLALSDAWLSSGKKGLQITGVNLEQIALLSKNREFCDYINSSDIVNIDGISVMWYIRSLGYQLCERTLSADIFIKMLETANKLNQSVYLLGAEESTVRNLVKNIKEKYPEINLVGYRNGFFKDEKEVVNDIAKLRPDYLFIGMPSPYKEYFITTYKTQLNAGICMGVGGMFDILGGKANRAPKKVQKMGLEWIYRIFQNPKNHTKRVFKAVMPCFGMFFRNYRSDFKIRKQL